MERKSKQKEILEEIILRICGINLQRKGCREADMVTHAFNLATWKVNCDSKLASPRRLRVSISANKSWAW
jgi:hypothetical protein